MGKLSKLFTLTLGSLLVYSCAPKQNHLDTVLVKDTSKEEFVKPEDTVVKDIQTELKAMEQAPRITMILMPKSDVQASISSMQKSGGKLIYDPNNGNGSTIPFYIAELTPEIINNTKAMKDLSLKAASFNRVNETVKPVQAKIDSENYDVTSFIPTDSVGLQNLGNHADLGEGVTVAVIDTGIDASHPAFNDRVVYWYDATDETRTELKKQALTNNTATIMVKGEEKKIILPAEVAKGDVYLSVMSESNFITQLDEGERHKKGFLDLNENKKDDDFLVAVSVENGEKKIYFDFDGDLKLAKANEKIAKINYNDTTKANRNEGMVEFPSRNNIVKYPLLLEEVDGKLFLGLGKTDGMHGTHVAGIVAANDPRHNLLGAAPKADLMSLRVCSGISCTDAAIIKGLYNAFYNGKVVPDVVNISLGSHEKYKKDIYSYLFNDLSAKFGTIFFISASNSGPGFRSLNHFGNSGAVVMVGANVSKKTLREQYNLPDDVETQDENLLFFSSLGPSFTSEMKPNIIAPGAAISATPAAGGFMGQANGTSMSSPIAAGTFAAVLSELKKDDAGLFNMIDTMRAYHLSGSQNAQETLLPYVYAMRDALQTAAIEQPDLTRAQQGFGLIDAAPTKTLLKSYMEELNNKERDYFEVEINGNKKTYDRSGKAKKVQAYKLTLGLDGERSKESLADLITSGVDIVLDRVEIIDTKGKVEVVTTNMTEYFALIERGNDNNHLLKTHVTFNNRRTPDFHSRRMLKKMKKGKTYLAHYKVMRKGVNISNILDVVHRAYELKQRDINVPSIDSNKTETKAGFAKKSVKIETNVFHRYPIMVTEQMNKLKVQMAIADMKEGRLYLQLYSPEGKEISFEVAQNASLYPFKQVEVEVPTAKKGKVQAGIWEITVSSSSSAWLSSSKYDLLVEADLFGAKKAKETMKMGETKIIPVQLGGGELSAVKVTNLQQVVKNKVKVKAFHKSYHPLVLPEGYTGDVEIEVNDKTEFYWGNLAPKLYTQKDGKFSAFKGKVSFEEGTFTIKEALTEKVYFALETLTNFSDAGNSKATGEVEVEVAFETEAKSEIETKIMNHANMDMALVEVKAKNSEIAALAGTKAYLRAKLMLISGEVEELTDIEGNIIYQVSEDTKINSVTLTIEK